MAGILSATPDAPTAALAPPGEEQAAVQHILGSRHFAKAPLLSSFLAYASQRALEDGMVRISEYEIGMNVFQRTATFDPREDNIVRTYARHLRKRLQEYYETDGENDKVRVELPKGTYVPVFHIRERSTETEAPMDGAALEEHVPQAELPESRIWWRRSWILGMAAILLVGYSMALYWIAQSAVHSRTAEERRSTLHPLWEQLFRPGQNTFIIPGDIGFVILQQANHRTFSLAEYLNWFSSQSTDSHLSMSYLRDQTYTSVLNLTIVSNLQRLPEARADRFILRATKNVRFDDLRDSNAILLGSNYSNPWTEIFGDKLNFQFVNHPKEDRRWIVNQHPGEGEASTYESTTTSTTHRTYAVIAFVQNLNKNGHVLLIQGLDTAGTQAAADMLFNSDEMQSFVQKTLGHDGATGSFELLIAADSLDANSHAMDSRIIASRFHH
jgi:hypothetical protein